MTDIAANTTVPVFRPLTADNFIKALQGEEVTDKNGHSLSFLENNQIIVKNVRVDELIHITEGTIFSADISFQNGFFQEFCIDGGLFECSVSISGGIFQGSFEIKNGLFQSFIHIEGGQFDSFSLRGGKYKDSISIEGNTRIDNFSITDGIYYSPFQIEGGRFSKIFIIWGGIFYSYFIICGGEFECACNINGGEFQKKLLIELENNEEKKNFIDEFYIDGGIFNDVLFYSGIFRKIQIDRSKIKRLTINGQLPLSSESDRLFIDELIIFLKTQENLNIHSSKINNLTISGLLQKDERIYLSDLKINILKFVQFENEGYIYITNIEGENKYLLQKDNNGNQAVVQETKNDSIFCFFNCSNIGNASFINTDFESFSKLVIQGSRINDIKTLTKHLPVSSDKKKIETDQKGGQDPQILEEIYNQLYLAMQKQGNRTQEIKYYAEYLEWHRKNKLRNLKEAKGFWNKFYKQDWPTPLSLWFHKHSSSYGTNWAKSLLWILGCGAVLYSFYVYSLDFKYSDIKTFGFYFRYFVEFVNPAHKMDFIPDVETNGWSALWDILGRIVIGFLIYQTIAAFRRFGRK